MSELMPVRESFLPPPPPQPTGPYRNPSYPPRVHIHERAYWQGVLASSRERLETALRALKSMGQSDDRPAFERLYGQMQGACDQVAETARRLPGEVGGLYEEDRERMEQAVAALDRVVKQWDALKA